MRNVCGPHTPRTHTPIGAASPRMSHIRKHRLTVGFLLSHSISPGLASAVPRPFRLANPHAHSTHGTTCACVCARRKRLEAKRHLGNTTTTMTLVQSESTFLLRSVFVSLNTVSVSLSPHERVSASAVRIRCPLAYLLLGCLLPLECAVPSTD